MCPRRDIIGGARINNGEPVRRLLLRVFDVSTLCRKRLRFSKRALPGRLVQYGPANKKRLRNLGKPEILIGASSSNNLEHGLSHPWAAFLDPIF